MDLIILENDTVFFNLPSRADPSKAVFGISCYRQMNAECLVNKSIDITRGTVQKSVCVLSTLPLYGLINAKLELVTHAYFKEQDFTKVSILEETFNYLNSSIKPELIKGPEIFQGLSVRHLVFLFKHRLVLLMKLMLLERKVLFLKSPVSKLCATILSLLSIFPGMIENGFENCVQLCATTVKKDKIIAFYENDEKDYKNLSDGSTTLNSNDNHKQVKEENEINSFIEKESSVERERKVDQLLADLDELLDAECKEKVDLTKSKLEFCDKDTYSAESDVSEGPFDALKGSNRSLASQESNGSLDSTSRMTALKGKLFNFNFWSSKDKGDRISPSESGFDLHISVEEEQKIKSDIEEVHDAIKLEVPTAEEKFNFSLTDVLNLDINKCGLPLRIFENGMLCHPYLSLPFLDFLREDGVRGFVAGATNVLFKQKKNLVDVIVDIEDGKIDILDMDLKKELYLTTEDLRFGDYLVKNVMEDQNDVFLDGTGWEGGDEWLRVQLKYYVLCLLRTSMLQEENRIVDSFNLSFMSAWKQTHNYNLWKASDKDGILEINPGHPFHGQIGVSDMKLRLSHTMQNSERGKKLNQAVVNTGKAVIQTSKVLGGAISQAKSTVFSWFQVSNSSPPECGDVGN
ncbi:hypothetical protein CHUAL_007408 [Chamberlinius hualienensis]